MAGGAAPSTSGGSLGHDQNKNYSAPLAIVTVLFFMWGFITCMNDILIPKFKEEFDLSNTAANLVQFAFFLAYFAVSLLYYMLSRGGFDPIVKYGYKKVIIIGLAISAIGCFLFVPAASMVSFVAFLAALFILATGITILQMGANPYVTLLGKPDGAEGRLNLTQAFNSLGTTVAPVLGGILIFGSIGLGVVKGPYIGLGAILIGLIIFIALSKLPTVVNGSSDSTEDSGIGAIKYTHLVLGVVCIFAYVGGEVTIGSNIIQYLKDVIHIAHNRADALLALYWGGAMVGRFYGAIFLGNKPLDSKKYLQIGMLAVLSFALGVFLVNKKYVIDSLNGQGEFSQVYSYSDLTGTSAIRFSELTSEESSLSANLDIDKLESTNEIALSSNGSNAVTITLEGDKGESLSETEFHFNWTREVVWDSTKLSMQGGIVFMIMALVNVLLFVLGKKKAGSTLGIFAGMVIVLLLVTVAGSGSIAMWAVLSIGLFNSIMFPTIFSLAIKGLGIDTSQGSSLLVMAIVGGGIIPLVQGAIADTGSVQLGFIVPMLCYAYIAYYGFIGSKPKGPGIEA